MKKQALLTLFLFFFITTLFGQFAEKSKNFQKFNGFFDFQYEEKTDKIYLEVTELEKEF